MLRRVIVAVTAGIWGASVLGCATRAGVASFTPRSPSRGQVVGHATDCDGRPLQSITLALGILVGDVEGGGLKFTTAAESPKARTNSRGYFQFDHVAPNRYVLHLPRNGYLRPDTSVLEVEEGVTTVDLHILRFCDVRGNGYAGK